MSNPAPPDFTPMNPWGRSMPKIPQRKGATAEMFQVMAETPEGLAVPVGPRWPESAPADQVAYAINKRNIDLPGLGLVNAHVVKVPSR